MKFPTEVTYIFDELEYRGYEVYLVGGCVRDSLLGIEPKDYDIATSAPPKEVQRIFKKTIPTGIKHGTITVMINDKSFEVTTFRKDGNYSDGRRPDSIEYAKTIREDLSRRDFTINAIAYNGENYIDPYGGMESIDEGLVIAVGDANERFQEDALRMLRAIRFATRFNFTIEHYTFEVIKHLRPNIKNVSIERIREELNGILLSGKPSIGFELLNQVGLLELILPELHACVGFDQKNPHHDKTVFEHILSVVDNSPFDLNTRWGALFHDIAKPQTFTIDENGIGHFYNHHVIGADMAENIMKRLKFDNKSIEQVVKLVRHHMDRYTHLRTSNIKKFINRVGVENLNKLFELQIADIKGSVEPHDISNVLKLRNEVERILNEKQPLSYKDLAINGRDLMEIGIPEGKEIGRILNYVLDVVLDDNEMNTYEQLIEFVKHTEKLS